MTSRTGGNENHMKKNRRVNAFTLIELLTVIAIIAVLIGLLFPAIKSALLKAEITKAKVQMSNLETAFKSYYTEYGHWPVADANSNITYIVDTNLVALLQGLRNTATLTGPSGFTYPSGAPLLPPAPFRIIHAVFRFLV